MVICSANQQNNVAAACLVVPEDRLAELRLGPALAVARLFLCTGLGRSDIGLADIDEPFASPPRACLKDGGWDDPAEFDLDGSTMSLGHPIGATGGLILAARGRERRRRNGRYGLEVMCGGGLRPAAKSKRAV
ncbi:MAG: hypothetical protein Q8L23_06980 [Caulobacter sp.]|nr:hypothetical protein [Caulobacter sp.]